MKRAFLAVKALFLCMVVLSSSAYADLDTFLSDLDILARADVPGFRSSLEKHFSAPIPEVEMVLGTVKYPSDAFMCFQLSRMTGIHVEKVVDTYRSKASGGWGVIAKELGIKPGFSAFHALKRGEFEFFGVRGGETKAGQGKGKEKSKGKGKGHK